MASIFQTMADVFTDVRYQSGKDATTLINSDLFRIANKYYLPLVRELIDLNEDIYGQISSTSLVANQREYPLPTDNTDGTGTIPYGGGLIKIQRVEIAVDNVNWHVANPFPLEEIPGPTILDVDLNRQFNTGNPIYWFKDRSLWLAPVPGTGDAGVVGGNTNLRIYWIQRKKEVSATTDIPSLPKDFLGILCEGMLIDVFRRYGRQNDMKIAIQNWQAGIAKIREMEAAPDTEQQTILKAFRKNYR